MIKPQRLYKYVPASLQVLLNLKSSVLYFGSPRGFNDPYDCNLYPRIKTPSPSQLSEFRAMYESKSVVPDQARNELISMNDEQLVKLLSTSAQKVALNAIERLLSTRGITCFSECNDNILMWAHYANSSQGLCLEFDTAFEPFSKVRKVYYDPFPPEIDLTQGLLDGDYAEVDRLYCTKSIDWAYEREWRGIHSEAGTRFHYEQDCLTGIYFGSNVDRSFLEIVCLILQGQSKTVKFYEGRRSQDEFKVVFQEFYCTNFLKK
jgi:hypothetical protein